MCRHIGLLLATSSRSIMLGDRVAPGHAGVAAEARDGAGCGLLGLLRPLQDSYRAVEGRDRVHLLAVFADGHRDEVTESSAVSAPIVGVTAGVSALIVDDNLADTALYS